ncbi:MAG: hypothetical protein QM778_13395 [Myxococcales bacterium]
MSGGEPAIELFPGAEELAFATIMVDLIRTNLADRPPKRRDFEAMRGRVALVAEDIGLSITLRFQRGRLSVHPGLFGIPNLVVRGPSSALIDLSRLPPHPRLKFLPDLGSDVARALGTALRERSLRIYGLLGHAGLGLRFARVLSIY